MIGSTFSSPAAISLVGLRKISTNCLDSLPSRNALFPPNSSFGFGPHYIDLFPLTCRVYRNNKDPVLSFRATGSKLLVQPMITKDERKKATDVGTPVLEDGKALFLNNSTFEKVYSEKTITSSQSRTLRKEKNPKMLNSSASGRNILDNVQIIKYPLVTESAINAILDHNTLVFVVDKHATKKNIKDAVKKMFKIQAKKVNTLVTPDGNKKGYVMLTSEYNALDVAKKIKAI